MALNLVTRNQSDEVVRRHRDLNELIIRVFRDWPDPALRKLRDRIDPYGDTPISDPEAATLLAETQKALQDLPTNTGDPEALEDLREMVAEVRNEPELTLVFLGD